MKKGLRLRDIANRIENALITRVIRSGLVNMIPVLIIGAFALILKTFPVEAYQTFIAERAGGFFLSLFDLVYSATFGVLSVYMTFFISRSYMKQKADPEAPFGGACVAALLSFFILSGSYLSGFGTDNMGPKSMFLAIITGIGATALYVKVHRFLRKGRRLIFSRGADREFNRMLSTLTPIAVTAVVFALIDMVIMRIFGVDSVHAFLIKAFNALFFYGETGFLKGFCFVLLSSVLWFFGIHGSDTLEGVMQTYFTPGLEANMAAVSSGGTPSVVLTKEFFDCFVLMGGCGAAICLLIAILLFSRNRSRRGLGYAAAIPMIFNINELMVFGLPVIFNFVLVIPFLLVPLVCYTTSYIAISTGLVPVITHEVAWTTPIILGGFRATGSAMGSALQLLNVVIGVLIYMPFIRILDRESANRAQENFALFMDYFKENEQELFSVRLTDQNTVYGEFAKELCAELRHDMKQQTVLYYQPQYHYDGHCIGVESLLRWEHPLYGMLYPPLVIKMAEEGGFLPELEERILLTVINERPAVLERFGEDVKISVNVTGTTVVTPRYIQFCRQLNTRESLKGKNICIEVTEQAAITFNRETLEALRELKEIGFLLAIDDFSMGQTSLNYLKDSLFDIIKLDGSLVKGLSTHRNCREIIFSITGLADSLNLTVLAEYVETEEQKEVLHSIGCDVYQGYLYSPAVPL